MCGGVLERLGIGQSTDHLISAPPIVHVESRGHRLDVLGVESGKTLDKLKNAIELRTNQRHFIVRQLQPG